jgi:hypothetical protein
MLKSIREIKNRTRKIEIALITKRERRAVSSGENKKTCRRSKD